MNRFEVKLDAGNSTLVTAWAILAPSLVLLVVGVGPGSGADSSDEALSAAESPRVMIDKRIGEVWREYDLKCSRAATDGEWCRRVFLDLIGRIPKVDELTGFLKDRPSTRREELVQRLLYTQEYRDEYARHWTTIWTNWLIGRTGGTEDNSLTNREGMRMYLLECFVEDKPYDLMVRELITAAGPNSPDRPNFNGATNFLAMKLSEKASQATADTSKLFLGLQVQCTQCHDHPFNDWKQNQFWELNAFFRQTAALRRFGDDGEILFVELVDEDFPGEGSTPSEAEIYYERRNGDLEVAYPVFVNGAKLENLSGYASDVIRREALANLIVDSEYFDKAIVNRMWSYFLGYGFTKPIDDMRPDNPPTHPLLLESLGAAFRQRGFHLKQLYEWVVLSEPYGLSSRIGPGNEQDDPTLGEPPRFSRFYLRQMRAEQLYASLLAATQADMNAADDEKQESDRRQWLSQFTRAFGTDDGGEATNFDGTIPQALMMMNGRVMKEAVRVTPRSLLGRMATSDIKPRRKIEYLFLAGLSRKPTSQEVRMANRLLESYVADSINWTDTQRGGRTYKRQGSDGPEMPDPTTAALQDIWWSILNSNEFILVH